MHKKTPLKVHSHSNFGPIKLVRQRAITDTPSWEWAMWNWLIGGSWVAQQPQWIIWVGLTSNNHVWLLNNEITSRFHRQCLIQWSFERLDRLSSDWIYRDGIARWESIECWNKWNLCVHSSNIIQTYWFLLKIMAILIHQ